MWENWIGRINSEVNNIVSKFWPYFFVSWDNDCSNNIFIRCHSCCKNEIFSNYLCHLLYITFCFIKYFIKICIIKPITVSGFFAVMGYSNQRYMIELDHSVEVILVSAELKANFQRFVS